MSYLAQPARGFVLGKFMPPHAGHLYLCDFARAYVGELTILVCSLPDDPIPGDLRHAWMKELCPSARVVHCQEILPQLPEDDPKVRRPDTTRAEELLGWRPTVPSEEGLRKTLAWFAARREEVTSSVS